MAKKAKPKPKPKLAMAGGAAPAAEDAIVVATDVPEERVDATIEGFTNAGATEVDKEKQANGKYTLTATFPN